MATAVVVAVVAAIVVGASSRGGSSAGASTSVGTVAPDGTFITTAGLTRSVASLRGQPALLWFVATWCSSCQAGTQAVASQIDKFAARHVRVVEVELAEDLGQAGPSITDFGRQFAGGVYNNPDWTWGVASAGLSHTYDPSDELDIYYLLDASGHIAYVNSSPASTMEQLLGEADRVSAQA